MMTKHTPIHRPNGDGDARSVVPPNHLVRKTEAALDFSFIYELVKDLYSAVGRPSIDPVILIKLTIIQYTFDIRSMRKTLANWTWKAADVSYFRRFPAAQ